MTKEAYLTGVRPGAPGLAGQPIEFLDLARRASAEAGCQLKHTVHNYWLVSTLYHIASSPADCRLKDGRGHHIGKLVFAGGTALINAWGIGTRHSEDLDLVVLSDLEYPGRQALSQMIDQPVNKAIESLRSVAVPRDQIVDRAEGFRTTELVTQRGDPIRVDVVVEAPERGIPLTARRRVMSTMGRVASAEQLAEFSELGGYEVECALPAWTAGNKFLALQKRAVRGKYPPDFEGIAKRGRDLYDFHQIAGTEHGPQVRSLLDGAASRNARPLSRRREAARPPRGFGSSPLFRPGTDECEALMFGYERAVHDLVWGDPPAFEEALRAASELDLR